MALIIDIETTSWFKSEEHKQLVLAERQDSRLKDLHKIAENHKEIIQKAALSPYTGQITCVGLRWTGVGESIFFVNNLAFKSNDDKDIIFAFDSEAELLRKVWNSIEKEISEGERLVGFASKTFDLPYLFIRSLVNGVERAIDYQQLIHPYQHDIHLDIKSLFDKGSLKEIAYVLDCRTENETDGSELSELWYSNPQAVIDKCKSDLIQTEKIYERIKGWIPQRLQMFSSSKEDITGLQ